MNPRTGHKLFCAIIERGTQRTNKRESPIDHCCRCEAFHSAIYQFTQTMHNYDPKKSARVACFVADTDAKLTELDQNDRPCVSVFRTLMTVSHLAPTPQKVSPIEWRCARVHKQGYIEATLIQHLQSDAVQREYTNCIKKMSLPNMVINHSCFGS